MSKKYMNNTDVLEAIHEYTDNIFRDNQPELFLELSNKADSFKKPSDTGRKWWKQKFTDDVLIPLNNRTQLNLSGDKITLPKLKKIAGQKSFTIQSDIIYIKKNYIDAESNLFLSMAFTQIDAIKETLPYVVDVYNQLNKYPKTYNISNININSPLSVIIYEPKPPVLVRGQEQRPYIIKKPLQFTNNPDKFILFYKTHIYDSDAMEYTDSIVYLPVYALNYNSPEKSTIYFNNSIVDILFPHKEIINRTLGDKSSMTVSDRLGKELVVSDRGTIANVNPYDINQYLHVVNLIGIQGKFLQGRAKFDIVDKTQFNLYSYENKKIVGVIEYNNNLKEGESQTANVNWCEEYQPISV